MENDRSSSRNQKKALKCIKIAFLSVLFFGYTNTTMSGSPSIGKSSKLTLIRVTNIAQEAVQSQIFVFPPPMGKEVGTTQEDGTIRLEISCDRVTKIQARPIGDAYYLSKVINCDKSKEKLHFKVYSIKTIKYLGANLINSASENWYGVAAMVAFDLQKVGTKGHLVMSPFSEAIKIQGWSLPKQMDRVFVAWKGDRFARKINFKYHHGTLDEYIGDIQSTYLLHPKYYFSIKADAFDKLGYKSVQWMHSTPFEIPVGQHAEYLTYYFVSKALKLKSFPKFNQVKKGLLVDVSFTGALKEFQRMQKLEVSGTVDYGTLEALSKMSIKVLRNTVVEK